MERIENESFFLGSPGFTDVFVGREAFRTAFMQRLMELKTKEVVYYAEPSDLEAYVKLKKNKDNSLIPVH